MKTFIILCLVAILPLNSATLSCTPENIVIMTVKDPDNYDAARSMERFAANDLRPLGYHVQIIEGDIPSKNNFPGLVEALRDADLLVLFIRRRTPPQNQLDAVRAYLHAGKPLVGIRTANHAFAVQLKDAVPETFAVWPDFALEVLGAKNLGYETRGLPYTVSVAPNASASPLLRDVHAGNILGHASLYKVSPLEPTATPLLWGTAQGQSTAQPIAWIRPYGPNQARIFYTSLGTPEDLSQPDVRRLLLNGIAWAIAK